MRSAINLRHRPAVTPVVLAKNDIDGPVPSQRRRRKPAQAAHCRGRVREVKPECLQPAQRADIDETPRQRGRGYRLARQSRLVQEFAVVIEDMEMTQRRNGDLSAEGRGEKA